MWNDEKGYTQQVDNEALIKLAESIVIFNKERASGITEEEAFGHALDNIASDGVSYLSGKKVYDEMKDDPKSCDCEWLVAGLLDVINCERLKKIEEEEDFEFNKTSFLKEKTSSVFQSLKKTFGSRKVKIDTIKDGE